jgi:hypothetical protein
MGNNLVEAKILLVCLKAHVKYTLNITDTLTSVKSPSVMSHTLSYILKP